MIIVLSNLLSKTKDFNSIKTTVIKEIQNICEGIIKENASIIYDRLTEIDHYLWYSVPYKNINDFSDSVVISFTKEQLEKVKSDSIRILEKIVENEKKIDSVNKKTLENIRTGGFYRWIIGDMTLLTEKQIENEVSFLRIPANHKFLITKNKNKIPCGHYALIKSLETYGFITKQDKKQSIKIAKNLYLEAKKSKDYSEIQKFWEFNENGFSNAFRFAVKRIFNDLKWVNSQSITSVDKINQLQRLPHHTNDLKSKIIQGFLPGYEPYYDIVKTKQKIKASGISIDKFIDGTIALGSATAQDMLTKLTDILITQNRKNLVRQGTLVFRGGILGLCENLGYSRKEKKKIQAAMDSLALWVLNWKPVQPALFPNYKANGDLEITIADALLEDYRHEKLIPLFKELPTPTSNRSKAQEMLFFKTLMIEIIKKSGEQKGINLEGWWEYSTIDLIQTARTVNPKWRKDRIIKIVNHWIDQGALDKKGIYYRLGKKYFMESEIILNGLKIATENSIKRKRKTPKSVP